MKNKKNLILLVVGLTVVGALLSREYPVAGMVLVAVAIGAYVAADLPRTLRGVRGFRRAGWNGRLRTMLSLVFILVFAGIVATGRVTYFPILLLLAIDYMLYVK